MSRIRTMAGTSLSPHFDCFLGFTLSSWLNSNYTAPFQMRVNYAGATARAPH